MLGRDEDGFGRKIQERVKIFLWLSAHGKILTNAERGRRHMTSNLLCSRCLSEEEGSMHALRDCYKAKEVWNVLILTEDTIQFYGQE